LDNHTIASYVGVPLLMVVVLEIVITVVWSKQSDSVKYQKNGTSSPGSWVEQFEVKYLCTQPIIGADS
jgi:uncharacterized membrane protein (DUF4010 family)